MRVVDDLERRGLAVRKSVPGDRRVRGVEITTEGLELFDAAHAAAEPLAERLVSVMGPGEAQLLRSAHAFRYGSVIGLSATRHAARRFLHAL